MCASYVCVQGGHHCFTQVGKIRRKTRVELDVCNQMAQLPIFSAASLSMYLIFRQSAMHCILLYAIVVCVCVCVCVCLSVCVCRVWRPQENGLR